MEWWGRGGGQTMEEGQVKQRNNQIMRAGYSLWENCAPCAKKSSLAGDTGTVIAIAVEVVKRVCRLSSKSITRTIALLYK